MIPSRLRADASQVNRFEVMQLHLIGLGQLVAGHGFMDFMDLHPSQLENE